jgi:hypothetical protein
MSDHGSVGEIRREIKDGIYKTERKVQPKIKLWQQFGQSSTMPGAMMMGRLLFHLFRAYTIMQFCLMMAGREALLISVMLTVVSCRLPRRQELIPVSKQVPVIFQELQ